MGQHNGGFCADFCVPPLASQVFDQVIVWGTLRAPLSGRRKDVVNRCLEFACGAVLTGRMGDNLSLRRHSDECNFDAYWIAANNYNYLVISEPVCVESCFFNCAIFVQS